MYICWDFDDIYYEIYSIEKAGVKILLLLVCNIYYKLSMKTLNRLLQQ